MLNLIYFFLQSFIDIYLQSNLLLYIFYLLFCLQFREILSFESLNQY